MSYPKIFPIEPHKDGWAPIFGTASERLLHLCGLMPKTLKHVGGRNAIDWAPPSRPVPPWQISEETRPLKVTLVALKNIMKRVCLVHGVQTGKDIMKVHGNCHSLMALRTSNYRHVYVAAMAALDRPPQAALPPPRKPYA